MTHHHTKIDKYLSIREALRVTSTKVVQYLKIYNHRIFPELTYITLLDTSITLLVGKSLGRHECRHCKRINLSFIIKKQSNKPLQLYNHNIENSYTV